MGRVSDTPTWDMWGISRKTWLYHLHTTGQFDSMVKFYENGIAMMRATNKSLIGTHKYSTLIDLGLDQEIFKREKTIEFYEERLKELVG